MARNFGARGATSLHHQACFACGRRRRRGGRWRGRPASNCSRRAAADHVRVAYARNAGSYGWHVDVDVEWLQLDVRVPWARSSSRHDTPPWSGPSIRKHPTSGASLASAQISARPCGRDCDPGFTRRIVVRRTELWNSTSGGPEIWARLDLRRRRFRSARVWSLAQNRTETSEDSTLGDEVRQPEPRDARAPRAHDPPPTDPPA